MSLMNFKNTLVEPKTQQMSRQNVFSHVHALLEEARLPPMRLTPNRSCFGGADWVMGGKKLPGLKDLFFNMSVRVEVTQTCTNVNTY